jgi:Uma2 family endonuclease
MSTTARRVHYTYDQYRQIEDASPVRHEYLDGEIYAMAGGTPEHAALAASLLRLLGNQLPSACRAFTSDLRVRIEATGLATYPDVSVICGGIIRSREDPLAVVNPVLLCEVTSDSTEEYDRGEKLRHFMAIPSLREVLIVSHRGRNVSAHRRLDSGWTSLEAAAGEAMEILAIAGRLSVDELYRVLDDLGR